MIISRVSVDLFASEYQDCERTVSERTSLFVSYDDSLALLILMSMLLSGEGKPQHTFEVCAIELFEFPNDSPMAKRSGGVTVTPLSSSALIARVTRPRQTYVDASLSG